MMTVYGFHFPFLFLPSMNETTPSMPNGLGRGLLSLTVLWLIASQLQPALSKECFPARNGNAVLRRAVVVSAAHRGLRVANSILSLQIEQSRFLTSPMPVLI
jgi:hypothetical protein